MRNDKFSRQHVTSATRIFVGDRQVTPLVAISIANLGAGLGHTMRHAWAGTDLHVVKRPWMSAVLDEAVSHAERSYVAMAVEVSVAEDIARA